MAPLISVIMCTKNSSLTIMEALNSLKFQTFRDFELIVVDAKSTDDTIKLVKEIVDFNHKIIEQTNVGVYNAFNEGVRASSGRYIYFLHSDDRLASKNIFSNCETVLADESHEVIYGDVYYENLERTVKRKVVSAHFTLSMLQRGFMPPHTGTFVKRKLFNKFGYFDESFRISADYEWFLRVLVGGARAKHTQEVICYMKLGGLSNKSFYCRLIALFEDVRAVRKHKLSLTVVLLKKIRALQSFIR